MVMKLQSNRFAVCNSLALLLVLFISGPAKAENEYYELEDVTVTAERREEDPQEVPMSITVHTGEELNASGVESTLDLPLRTPGFLFSTNAVLGQPYIRGVGSDFVSIGSESTVAIYKDGVYQSRAMGALADFFDVERVEVVKGPQGTLYGRNATGGTVNIISRTPEPDLSMEADLIYGNYNKLRIQGMVNAPLVDDRVFLRLSGLSSDRDGFIRVVNLGTRTDDEDLRAGRAQLRILASEEVEVLVSADYMKEKGSRGLGAKVNSNLPAPQIDLFGGINPGDPREVYNTFKDRNDLYEIGDSLKITWDSGLFSLMSLTAYHETDLNLLIDIDHTDVDYSSSAPNENSKAVTQEFQFTSNDKGPLEWLAGVYYLHEKSAQELDFSLTPYAVRLNTFARNRTNAYAVYGQASYFLTDKWRATAGLRYGYEDKHHVIHNGAAGTLYKDASKGWGAWMPKFGLDFFATEDILAYVSATRGFKSGGFNSAGSGEQFNPEFIWSYEAGLKSSVPGGRLQWNASAFYYDYKDLQVQSFSNDAPGLFLLENAAQAEVKGLETDLRAFLLPDLDMEIGVALLDARFTEYATPDPDALDPTANQDLSGNLLPKAPELTSNVMLRYAYPLMGHGDLIMQGDWRYQSEVFFNQFNAHGVNQKGFHILNARLEFEAAGGDWRLALWGKNLTSALYRQNVIRNTQFIGSLDFWGAQRTFGFQAAYLY
ncbi:MAG: TonB-dependent receptor [Nitrospinae bacterium]|nr:TonB-dependent receptor [Nitrospinota bacterium]